MNKFLQKYSFAFILLMTFFLVRCAQQVAPLGGPKDERPPVLDEVSSTPNYQTNFELQNIELYFNEFIEVRDVFKQVLVSPPLDNLPRVSAKLKKIIFEFPEGQTLKDNATYTINFGSSIRDFTEGNVLKDFRFVFSTGDFIDSLELSGTVVNSFDGNPEKEVVVMLYDNYQDSVVYLEKPFYFASTDNNGKFKFENLRSDSFKIFALKDANLNYLYDSEAESIGFLNEKIYVNDTIVQEIRMELFLPLQKTKIIDKELKEYGRLSLLFNKEPLDIQYEFSNDSIFHYSRIDKDSLIIYYNLDQITPVQLVVKELGSILDTLKVNTSGKVDFLNQSRLFMTASNTSKNESLFANDKLQLSFNHPLQFTIDSLFSLVDTGGVARELNIEIDSLEHRQAVINANWEEGDELLLQILPGALGDIYGLSNDTLDLRLKINKSIIYGRIRVNIDSLNNQFDYIVELMKDKKVVEEIIIAQDTSQMLNFNDQRPGTYSIRITEDRNSNGRWDPGNYTKKEQSERSQIYPVGDLKENWEMNDSISWKKEIK